MIARQSGFTIPLIFKNLYSSKGPLAMNLFKCYLAALKAGVNGLFAVTNLARFGDSENLRVCKVSLANNKQNAKKIFKSFLQALTIMQNF